MNNKVYKNTLVKFMNFLKSENYTVDKEFTTEMLLEITPSNVASYLNFKAFHKTNPEKDDCPIYARSNTLLGIKRMISTFMPRKTRAWDPISNIGNPTRSEEVLNVIKSVQKFEVRHQGVSSKERRALHYSEFLSLLEFLDIEKGTGIHPNSSKCLLSLQWSLIGRIDDMCHLKWSSLMINYDNSYTLVCQLRWSKNILEERQSPKQILVGSMDYRLCTLLNLAIHAESFFGDERLWKENKMFGKISHNQFRALLNKIFKRDEFPNRDPSKPLGTHSIRKAASSYATLAGITKDNVQRRGRWRGNRDVVDRYIMIDLPYPDALAATVLAGPKGACKYKTKKGVKLDDNFLLNEIVPNCSKHLNPSIAKTLALPLIWAACNSDALNTKMKEQIQQALEEQFGSDTNIVEKIPIEPVMNGSSMNLVEVTDIVDDTADGNQRLTAHQNHSIIISQQLATKRRIDEMYNTIEQQSNMISAKFQKLQTSITRFVNRPALLTSKTSNTREKRVKKHGLSKTPRDLYTLWKEYEFGIDGNKPAKIFNSSERQLCKTAFCRRKIFWDKVSHLINRGYTADIAIDKIYAVYGRNTPLTALLEKMRVDRRMGGHPLLK